MFRDKSLKYWRNLVLFSLSLFLLAAISFGIDVAHDRAVWVVDPWRSSQQFTPDELGIPVWEDVSFQTSDGLRIDGWFYPPSPEADGAVIILLHGHAGHRGALSVDASILHSYGYGCLLIDLRNHGTSEGEYTTFGLLEWLDVQGAVTYLQTRSDVNPEKIGLMGHSLGGATSIMAAANIPEIKAVIAESAFATIQDNIESGVENIAKLPPFPFAPLVIWFGELEIGLDLDMVRPIDHVASISPRPILFIHGALDTTIPVDNSYRLYQAALEPKFIYIIENAGHGRFPQIGGEAYEQVVIDFFQEAFADQ